MSITLMLLSVGLATLYSASSYLAVHDGLSDWSYLMKQVQGVLIGAGIVFLVSQIDYHRWEHFAWPFLVLVIGMLVIVLIPGLEAIAPRVNGARRWLNVGVMVIQPSDPAKVALMIWTARTLVRKQNQMNSFKKGLLPLLLMWGIVVGLIAVEPSMSAALLCAILALLVAFVGNARIRHFIGLGILLLPAGWVAISGAEYRMKRIMTFLNREEGVSGASYQVNQGLTALGSGGWFGRGIGQSQMKAGFVPEAHNDFAASIFGEEWGAIGIILLVFLYLMIACLGYRIAKNAPDLFGSLLAIGMTGLFVVPAYLHLAINLALIPATGMALPFVSYGRSNLLVNFFALGILLNVAAAGMRRIEIRKHLHTA